MSPSGLIRLLPTSIQDHPRLVQRGRLMLGLSAVLAIAAFVVAFESAVAAIPDMAVAMVLVSGGLCVALNVMALRWHHNLLVTNSVLCGLHLLIIVCVAIMGQGCEDAALWWLTPAPLLAAFLIGPNFAWLAALLAGGASYVMYALESNGIHSFRAPEADRNFWTLFGILTVLAGVAAVARLYESFRREDVAALQHSITTLEQQEANLKLASEELRASRDSALESAQERSDFLRRMGAFSESQSQALEQTRGHTQLLVRSTATMAETAAQLSAGTQRSHERIDQLAALGQRVASSGRTMTEAMQYNDRAVDDLQQSIIHVDDSVTALRRSANTTVEAMVTMGGSATRVETFAVDMVKSVDAVVAASERGQLAVSRTRMGILSTRDMADQAVASIGLLRDSAEEIAHIIQVIDEVAAETGVLALNAAIIAAQTGEAGRSFAVVAEQIKAMARRVRKSTGESDQLLQRVRAQAQATESIITENAVSAVSGEVQSQEAAEALEHIMVLAEQSRVGAHQIRTQAGEQVRRASDVGRAMDEVNSLLIGANRAVAAQREIGAAFASAQAVLQRVAPTLLVESGQQASGADAIREQVRQVATLATRLQQLQSEQSEATAQALAAIEQLARSQDGVNAAMANLQA
jgi:methyl-accepting chemotaxis protein